MSDVVSLIHTGGLRPAYLNPEALSTYPDLRLLSKDGFYFEMNRAVFASLSKLTEHFRDDEDHFAITTELLRDDLETVVRFILTGCLPFNMEADETLNSNFLQLGIDLSTLDLGKYDTGVGFNPESQEIPWRDNNPSLKFEWVSNHTQERVNTTTRKAAGGDAEPDENGAIPVRMIKLEPDIDTRYYGGYDSYARPQVKMETDDDYYANYEDDEDYFPKPKKRGRPKGFTFPGETKSKRGRKKGTRNKTANGVKLWKIMPEDDERDENMKYQCAECNFGTKTPFAIVQHEFHHKNPGLDDELYHCIVCKEGFEKDSMLQKHHKEVHNDIIYTCEFCERKFSKERYAVLVEHLKQMHNVGDNKVSYFCIQCGMAHNLQSSLRNHIRRMGPHHGKKCAQCPKEFENYIDHETHVKNEHDNNWMYVCGLCDMVFDNKKKRNRHRNNEHESRYESKFCDLCGKYVKLIVQHKQVVHGIGMEEVEGGAHPCQQCDKAFKYKSSLDKHMDSAHSTKTEEEKRAEREANKVMCPTCGKTYQTSAGLQFHIAKSHAPKEELPFRCAYCPKAFLHKYHLDNHENQQHTGIRAFKCGLCDKTFAVKNIRDKHERFVCKKVLNYPCELCPKKFSSNTKRDHHILSVHTEDSQKPFQCSYCSKGFATKFTLSEHENTHTNARPNLCPICGMGFNNQASRNAHVKNKHPKDGDVKPVIPKPAPPPPQVTTTPQPVVVASPPPQQQQQHQVQVLQIHPSAQQQHHQHQVPQQLLIQQGPGQPPQVVSVVQQVVVSQPMQFNN